MAMRKNKDKQKSNTAIKIARKLWGEILLTNKTKDIIDKRKSRSILIRFILQSYHEI